MLLLIALCSLLAFQVVGADYDCSLGYRKFKGKCYDCPYNNLECNRPSESVIYKNGVIYTVDKTDPYWHMYPKEAMVVAKGKITFVGSNVEAMKHNKPKKSRIVDLKWKTILPGFHDPHMHPLEANHKAAGTCELQRDTKPEDQLHVFEEGCFHNQKGTNWTLGWGHSVYTLLEYVADNPGKNPKDLLDPLIVDDLGNAIPAVMMEFTSHSVWVNSKALELAGVTKDTKNENGNIYMKNPNTGEPNGIVLENAGIEMFEKALDPKMYPNLRQMNYDAALASLFVLAKHGITSAVDARNYWKREHDKAWEKVEAEGKLTAKMILSMWAYPAMNDTEQIAKLKSFFQRNPAKRLKKSQIKVYMDGILPTRTAKVLEPYVRKDPDLQIGDHGMNYFTENRLFEYLSQLQNLNGGEGYDFIIHQVGDGAGREALNAIEDAKPDATVETRHKLTHVELLNTKDIPRFKTLGVIADGQVAGTFTMPGSPGHKELESFVGKAKAHDTIPLKSLVDSGAKVTMSSDYDVSDVNPFNGLANALQRSDQSIDLKTAVELYTINGAFSMRQEDRTGSLEVGKDADFVVVDKDIFNLEYQGRYNEIRKTKVLLTVLEGEDIWKTNQKL
ncbi:hypothetical protein TCAL_11177 [Tigriopus californicus]|uniref:Amidohydrolase 3 domain-containing protein n=1 Tax=Tigriopus californicus TaxID=6832 RepID=A0A553P294_TIGCA|nr:putative amidohydrolase YtcJ [Tigriopus californicus]TRY71803.1 hypothetical protein TCAL_11177 [Tigriopus californicus]|eukprot:TCALIF_11177-PA protein Name:"Similar to ytcJ Putative amidohydrolase YtcJ (Bacillus subtilis (strain 168))" AED:0.03 eAED:0.03 QI:51/1/0.75/1/1/1/4/139/615